jgi:hypothetical protein
MNNPHAFYEHMGARKMEPDSSSNQDYHEMLDDIVQADTDYVRAKDKQYDSSWKRRGGVGAYFTIVRPWDRLENFAKAQGYDLFAAMQNDPLHGPDGTALACVRDMRRYLLLLEAWIVWDRTRDAEKKSGAWWQLKERLKSGVLVTGFDLGVAEERVMMQHVVQLGGREWDAYTLIAAGMFGVLASEVTPEQRQHAKERCFLRAYSADEPEQPGSPADGGHHERLYDDVRPEQRVNTLNEEAAEGEHCDLDYRPVSEARDAFHNPQPGDRACMPRLDPLPLRPVHIERLEDGLTEMPPAGPNDAGYYPVIPVTDPSSGKVYFNVDRSQVDAERTAHLPRLDTELNHKEWTDLVPEYRGMYMWHEGPSKYVLSPLYRTNWGRRE